MNNFFPVLVIIMLILANFPGKKKNTKQQTSQPIPKSAPQSMTSAPRPVSHVSTAKSSRKQTTAAPKKAATPIKPSPADSLPEQDYGSIVFHSSEGMEDPDHDHGGVLTAEPLFSETEDESYGFRLSFASDDLVNAVIMQEVLSKPVSMRR